MCFLISRRYGQAVAQAIPAAAELVFHSVTVN